MKDSSSIFSKKNQYRKKIMDSELEKTKEITIGVLIRVSSDMQVANGDSLEMQQELAQNYAKEIGGVIFKFYIEEAVSASKIRIDKRSKVQELIADIKEGNVNFVIAYKRDRMFRNTIEHMQFVQFLADYDCGLYYTARGELQTDLTAFKVPGVSKIIESLLSNMAEMETAQTASRVSDTMISKALRGEFTGGRIPVGYKMEDGELIPIEGAKEIIEVIEDMYLSGYGVKSISRWLNGGEIKGVKTLETPYPKLSTHSKNDQWNERNVKTILFNPIYTGHSSYQSKINKEMDRIVERSDQITPMRTIEKQEEIFELQQKKTKNQKPARAYSTPFILTGIIYCDECGGLLKTHATQPKNGKKYSYYLCGGRYTDKAKKCNMSRIYRKEIIEKLILEEAKKKLEDFLNLDTYEIYRKKLQKEQTVAATHIDTVNERIKQLDLKLNQISHTITSQLDENKPDDSALIKHYLGEQKQILIEINELKEAKVRLIEITEQEKKEKDSYERFLELASNYSNLIEDASVGIKKQIFEELFSGIYINNKGDIRLELKVGINKKQSIERMNKTLLKEGEGSNIPNFISLETIRDAKALKYINVQSYIQSVGITDFNEWTSTFNYFEILQSLYEKVRICFYPFLCFLDNKFSIQNAHLINEEELIDYVPAIKPSQIKSKKMHMYIQQKLNVNKATRIKIIYGHLPPYSKLKKYLKSMDSNIDNFFSYVKTHYPDFILNELLFEEVEAAVNSKSIKPKRLFQGLIKCKVCGNEYVGKKEGKGVRYTCIKNRTSNKQRCYSPRIKEPILIELFEQETNMKIERKLLLEMVDKISVSENDKATIHYRQKEKIYTTN